ncbi:MAG: hypothetical protein WDM87_03515 [Terracidiphilus sp.]
MQRRGSSRGTGAERGDSGNVGLSSKGKGRVSEYNHLLVLAQNEEGYQNLIRLTSEASCTGFTGSRG